MSLEEQRSRLEEERRIANAGGLARWARGCARTPGGSSSAGSVRPVLLIVLVAGFHGSLVNEFKVPGTDFQKATDLINAKFGAQKGAALRVVMAAPPGERSTRPSATAAVAKMLADRAGRREVAGREPGQREHDHRPARARLAAALEDAAGSPSSTPSSTRPASSCRATTWSSSRISCAPIGEPVGHPGRVHRRGREPAARAGCERDHRPHRGLLRPDDPVPRARAHG